MPAHQSDPGRGDRAGGDYHAGPFSMDEPTERERLGLLERYRDEDTQALLESLPVRESWRCLEIGAGAGSIARWLAARCTAGRVLAADIDTRHLSTGGLPNLYVQQVDIATHDFAPGSFDLVHARAVLCHLPARDEIVQRACGWLTPGGWLVVEDVYTLPAGASPYPAMNRYAVAAERSARQRGADMQWGNKLPALMARGGLVNVGVDTRPRLVGSGGVADELWRVNLTQAGGRLVRDGLLAQQELDECLVLLDAPAFLDIRYFSVAARGQRAAG